MCYGQIIIQSYSVINTHDHKQKKGTLSKYWVKTYQMFITYPCFKIEVFPLSKKIL